MYYPLPTSWRSTIRCFSFDVMADRSADAGRSAAYPDLTCEILGMAKTVDAPSSDELAPVSTIMSCYAHHEEKLVCFGNLSGICHMMRVFPHGSLALYHSHICKLFQMLPTYIVKLIDEQDRVYMDSWSKPFQNKSAHFTVVFQWKSIWDANDCGRLSALTNECNYKEVDYPCYALTVHKAQTLSIKHLVLGCLDGVFSQEQFYVLVLLASLITQLH